MKINHLFWDLSALAITLVISACGVQLSRTPFANENPTLETLFAKSTPTPFQPEGNSSSPTVTALSIPDKPTLTSVSSYLWISSAVPDYLRQLAMKSGLPLVDDVTDATVSLDIAQSPGSQTATWIYALVAPFPTISDNVPLTDIQNAWRGSATGPFSGRPLWMDASTLAAFTSVWGVPATNSVSITSADRLIDSAWAERPAWAIIPFEALDPRWKVISVDGQSPVHNDFDATVYPLKIYFNLEPPSFPITSGNRDPNKLTVLAMTGTTALVRATADRMELHGVLYPGEEVRTVLRSADITHISNEVSFMTGCPVPDPWTNSLQFCSDPRYIALLKDVGTDIVELTGNHLLDYGPKPFLTTLDLYDQNGLHYYGGGRNLQDSLQPVLVQDHGNKLAFIGCNIAGPPDDWATDDRPGSAPCNFDQLSAEIGNLRSSGYLPVMTFQYNEYYQPNPTDYERRDFIKLASAGAVIVSGSQAHVPAAMEFSAGSFIHYGLGNLFFDQMSHLMPDGSVIFDTRDVFIDRHIIYDGHYISTELLSFIIEDYSRPRPMTAFERRVFLLKIFNAAGW